MSTCRPILLAEQPGQGGAVLICEPELFADPAVPVLGECLCHLDAETMEVEIVLVLVVGLQASDSSEARDPMVATMKLAQSGSPEATGRKKSLMHSQGASV